MKVEEATQFVFISRTADNPRVALFLRCVFSSDASASRTKARPTALSRQLNFYAATTNSRSHPHAVGPRKGRKVTEARKGFRYQPVELSARRWPRWERNFSRSSRTPSLHTLSHSSPRASIFFAFPPVFFFLLSSFLSFFLSFHAFHPFSDLRPTRRTYGAKLSVISDRMARLTPARFYAPSWITWARTSIVCTRAWRWKLEKKRNSAPKCCDASIMKHGKREAGW